MLCEILCPFVGMLILLVGGVVADFSRIEIAAKADKITLTEHAAKNAVDRKITVGDIKNALLNNYLVKYSEKDNKFNVYGYYSDLYFLLVSCAYFEGVVVITTHKVLKKRIKT